MQRLMLSKYMNIKCEMIVNIIWLKFISTSLVMIAYRNIDR